MKLHDLCDNRGARKSRKRVGRGIGSGLGKTGGRGQKGQKSRAGVAIKGFEGGQMPLHMRLPKRGFNNIFARDYAEVNLDAIQRAVDLGRLDPARTIDHAALKAAGLARGGRDGVRLLGRGILKARLNLAVAGISRSARHAVEQAGGAVAILEVKSASEKAREKHGTALLAKRYIKRATGDAGAAPYAPTARGAHPPFRDVEPWLQAWRNATPDRLNALRVRLDRSRGTQKRKHLLKTIHEAGELLRAAMNEPSMSSRTAVTPRDQEKAAAMSAMLYELQDRLLDGDEVVAGKAAIALALACAPDRVELASLPVDAKPTPAQCERIAQWLSHLLHEAGDHSYTSIFLINKYETADGIVLTGGFRQSRALPFSLAGARVVLPGEGAPQISRDILHMLATGAAGPVEILGNAPDPETAADEAVLFSCTFRVPLPRVLSSEVRLDVIAGNIANQSYVITPEALAAIPAI